MFSLVACAVYYWLWIHVIPKWRGYRMRHETVVLDGGEVTHRLVRVKLSKLEEWDKLHDAAGALVTSDSSQDNSSGILATSIEGKQEP